MRAPAHETQLLETRLTATRPLADTDRALLNGLPWRVMDVPARTQFVLERDHPTESCLVVSGIVVRSKYTQDGQRQILSTHIPGDLPDLQSMHLEVMDHGLDAVGPCRIAFVEHAALQRVCEASPSLTAALWRETLIDAALYRAAIFRTAQLESNARLAHFLCEMHLRHRAVGLLSGDGFQLSMSQELIGEALGLTPVSINRSAQFLRARNSVRMDRGWVEILNWNDLARFGQFDRTYLHLSEDGH